MRLLHASLLCFVCTAAPQRTLIQAPTAPFPLYSLVAHLQNTHGFTLQHLQYLVVDEADRLLRQDYQARSGMPSVAHAICALSRAIMATLHATAELASAGLECSVTRWLYDVGHGDCRLRAGRNERRHRDYNASTVSRRSTG